ncbi:TonB-dependent receptor [Caulobacter soli]|uniref:TonB-dependent receptor n=1 Tax=Caulobacter soli TaxID=2708539 RepID=UPI00196AF780|nr:TonB-dependent siderophore receptor [Caulobacter soli]
MTMSTFAVARSRRVLLLATSAASLLAGAAFAADAPASGAPAIDQESTNVSGVTVTAGAKAEAESRERYKVDRSLTATKTDTPLINVPQSVSVISLKQISDQAASSIGDAVRYVPGVSSAQGEGNRETLVFRGNQTTGDFFVDGVRDDVQTYRDLYNIDRLEIFRGPNAMIFGRGGIGGVANRVTKMAGWTPVREIKLETGSYDHYRGSFDVGGPTNDIGALRLTGVYENSGSYRDDVDYERWGLNPTAAFKANPDTVVQLSYEHFEDERVADRGVSSHFRPANVARVQPLRTPRGQFFGDPTQSPTWTNTDAATLFIEHQISDTVSIRNRTRYADYDKFYQNVFAGAVNAAETTVEISAYNNATQRRNFINQTDLNAKFSTGSIEHTLLAGAEFSRQTTDNLRQEGRFAGGAATLIAPINQPNIRAPITWVQIASSARNKGVAKVAAGYVQDQIELTSALQIVAGVRYENFETVVHDLRTVGFPAGQQRDFDVTDKLWSPRVGVIYKPVASASIYAGYSKTYQPRGGDQLTSLSLTNQNLAPEKFQNYEIGAKWDVTPDINLSVAVFQLDRDNVLALANPNDPTSASVPVGRQRTKGVELAATGKITDQLNVIGAYTYLDGTFLDNVSGTVKAGNILPNMPKNSASLWTRYDINPKLGGAVGVIHQGERYAATDNTVYMPGFTRVDAALYYTINEKVAVQVNAENLLNERYFLFANSNTNITPGSPTAFKVGLTAKF